MNTEVKTSSVLPTPAVKGMLQFCRSAYPVPIRAGADLLLDPVLHRLPVNRGSQFVSPEVVAEATARARMASRADEEGRHELALRSTLR